MEFNSANSAQYDAVMADLNLDVNPPPGAKHHLAGPVNGGWRVIDIWESEEQFHTFVNSRLGALIAKHGITPPTVTAIPIHNTWQPPA